MMDEDNLQMQMREPWMKFGSDAEGANPDKPGSLTHPRAYGNFTRVLGKYVREEKVMPLEEAIRKMTSATATRLSLHDRGVLREGLVADVVVFDPATVADRATFDKPHQVSVGVEYVFVNGVAVIDQGKHTGAMPGKIVRGPGYGQR
jgi:dihydroorotase/N-acyl-D-amino-acid deacylase